MLTKGRVVKLALKLALKLAFFLLLLLLLETLVCARCSFGGAFFSFLNSILDMWQKWGCDIEGETEKVCVFFCSLGSAVPQILTLTEAEFFGNDPSGAAAVSAPSRSLVEEVSLVFTCVIYKRFNFHARLIFFFIATHTCADKNAGRFIEGVEAEDL